MAANNEVREGRILAWGGFILGVLALVVPLFIYLVLLSPKIDAVSVVANSALRKAEEVERSTNGIGITLARIEETLVWIKKALEENVQEVKSVRGGREHVTPGK